MKKTTPEEYCETCGHETDYGSDYYVCETCGNESDNYLLHTIMLKGEEYHYCSEECLPTLRRNNDKN